MAHTHTHDSRHGHDHDHDHDHDHAHHTHDLGPERNFTVAVTSPSQTRRVLSIQVPAEEMEKARADVLAGLRKELRVPGFRKGKVPVAMIQKHYSDVIESDAVRNLLPLVFEQALDREHLHPLGEPRFENVRFEEGGVAFEVSFDVRPDVNLSGYTGIAAEAATREVTDADVNQALMSLRERLAAFETVRRPATGNDHVVLDYVALKENGEPDQASQVLGYPVSLASESLLAEFRTGLVGAGAGDEREIQVTYPADFGDEALAGTSRTFKVKVTEVKEKLLPEADDHFAKRIDETAATILELRLRIRRQLEADEASRRQREIDDRVMEAIMAANPFEVPDIMVENYLSSLVEEDRRHRGPVPDEEARSREVREVFREAAERTIRRHFVLDAVRRQENITLAQEDVDERIRGLAERMGKSEDDVRALLATPERRRSLEGDLLEEKVVRFLRERNPVRA